jgi:hypothetical protein
MGQELASNKLIHTCCSLLYVMSALAFRVGREFPVVITGKYRPGKYSKFELKREILGNMIFRCD